MKLGCSEVFSGPLFSCYYKYSVNPETKSRLDFQEKLNYYLYVEILRFPGLKWRKRNPVVAGLFTDKGTSQNKCSTVIHARDSYLAGAICERPDGLGNCRTANGHVWGAVPPIRLLWTS